jgi:hypothetical protein
MSDPTLQTRSPVAPTLAPTRLTTAPPPIPPLPLTFAPFVPEDVRRRHHAFVASDTRFAAACRLLAALWRTDHDLPAGTRLETDAKGKTRRTTAGWRLRRNAAQAGKTPPRQPCAVPRCSSPSGCTASPRPC